MVKVVAVVGFAFVVALLLGGLFGLAQRALVVTGIGGILQIAGVILVFMQIDAAERLLGAEPWLRGLRDWSNDQISKLAAYVGIRRRGRVINLEGTSHGLTSGTARVTVSRNRGKTIEERLESLQLQIDDANRELDELRNRNATDHATFEAKLSAVESGLKSSDAAIRDLIEAVSIGSRNLQVFSAGLIVVGTALVTIGPFLG